MSKYLNEYKSKLRTADEAVKAVKSGDWVAYSHFACTPKVLDEALAKRRELINVNIRATCAVHPVKVAAVQNNNFIYNSGFFSAFDRQLHDNNSCFHVPGLYSEAPINIRQDNAPSPVVAMVITTPMDRGGYFNLSAANSYVKEKCNKATTVIVEINEKAPRCLGGNHENLHISEVDYIVEGNNEPLPEIPGHAATEVDKTIARLITEEIEDGACIQLGIGGLPNIIGGMIAESDLKNLGVHSEMMNDAFVTLYEAGKITGANKSIDRYKMVYTFALGSASLYEFIHDNPCCASYPVDYTNSPQIISQNEKQIAINNALEVDLFGQVSSESFGSRQISGTGGQVDFTVGAFHSRGGKAFICLNSTKKLDGKIVSRIAPQISPGSTVTTPRSMVHYIVTEYGKANLKGKPTWMRAEMIINLAHPDYREDLIKAAEKMKIWVKTNKRV